MIQRISLYNFETIFSMDDIVTNIIKMRYKQDSISGFVLSKVSHNVIKAKHIQKIITEKETEDPFGLIIKNKNQEFITNEFLIIDGLIKIINPSKNLSYFRKDLMKALERNCTLSVIKIDLNKLIENFNLLNYDFYINSLNIDTFSLFSDSESNLNIKGNKNLLENTEVFRKKYNHSVNKISFIVNDSNTEYQVNISEKGAIKIHSSFIEKTFIDILVDEISKFIKN